jgi:hypothetical protein
MKLDRMRDDLTNFSAIRRQDYVSESREVVEGTDFIQKAQKRPLSLNRGLASAVSRDRPFRPPEVAEPAVTHGPTVWSSFLLSFSYL